LAGSRPSAQDFNDMLNQHDAAGLVSTGLVRVERHPSGTLVIPRRQIGQRTAATELYAFKVERSGSLQVTVAGGNAYMEGETVQVIADTDLAVPAVDGAYVVYLRHNYGTGDTEGTWEALAVCIQADLPSTLDAGRTTGRNFIIATVTVASGRISGKPVQNWRAGDVWGYAPNLAPEEAPA
jgi:hypothetical protein